MKISSVTGFIYKLKNIFPQKNETSVQQKYIYDATQILLFLGSFV